jgi:peptidoglycan/LPS O-acetylase OafA/YrhL
MPSFGDNRPREHPTLPVLQIPPSPTFRPGPAPTPPLPQMSPKFSKHDSILDTGYWEGVKVDLNGNAPIPIRTSTWPKRILDFIRPAYFDRTGGLRKPLRRTAYLDGLRGFAAFMVYWGHHQLWARESIHADKIFENGFGYHDQWYFACFPGIRTFFSGGHFSVTVFFVISGYVLSAKPLQFIQSGELLKLGDNLASAMFRRWLRLWIPIICTTFLYFTVWHVFGIWTDSKHADTWIAEVWTWYYEIKNFSFVFQNGGDPFFSYSFHIWSIPVEFRGSVIIYTSLLAFSRLKRNARLLFEVGLIYYFLYIVDGWFGAMFMMGMLQSDLDLLALNNDLPRIFTKVERFKSPFFHTLFVLSIWLGGVPSHSVDKKDLKDTPGWYYLSFFQPQAVWDFKWFFLFWASGFIVASIPRISWLKRFFELPFNQYLGKISFSFYLVHGPIMWTLGDRLYVATGWSREVHAIGAPNWINIFPLSKSGPLGLELSFLVPHLIILPVTLWTAEIVTKMFDEPSVKFSQWLYNIAMAPSVKS